MVRPTVLFGQLLDLHLSRSIQRLKAPKMRGMQRLAAATQSVLKDMDDEAGKIADELSAAQADSVTVIAGFKSFVAEIRANTENVRHTLAQLTNGAPPGPLPDTVASPPATPAVPS